MSKERVVMVVRNDKKRASLAAFLSGLGMEVENLTALPEPDAGPGLAIGLSALVDALQGEKGSKENLRRLKKEFNLLLRKSRELEEAHDTTLENFMAALDLRDVETYGHSKTVARYSHVLAEAVGIRDPRTLDSIHKGALLHDAGKMAIPDSILKKPGPLSNKEWEVIRRHPVLGYGLVRDVKLVREVGNIILCHHEKYDGTGYPKGLKGAAIPLEARIFAVADTLDAVTSHRPYRAPRDFRVARQELVGNAGKQFDPKVVDVFCGMDLAVWEKIRFQTTRLLPPIEDYLPSVANK
ncbi:MAG: HD-GYP domain-containing protein [Candidatus Aminicenantes bacterium]|nr:HD-GYP domain-containing protein [Candidatus Aminicenantes bacterium]